MAGWLGGWVAGWLLLLVGRDGQLILARLARTLVLCTTGNKADALEIMMQNPAGALPSALYRTVHCIVQCMYAAGHSALLALHVAAKRTEHADRVGSAHLRRQYRPRDAGGMPQRA